MKWNPTQIVAAMLLLCLAPFSVAAQDSADFNTRRREQVRKQLDEIRVEHTTISGRLLALIEEHGTLVMSREKVLDEMSRLEEEAWNSQVEREQAQIRAELLTTRLKKKAEASKSGENVDEVAALLEKKLALAVTRLNRVNEMKKAAAISESEIEVAESLVTDAQLALAQHREAKKQSPEAEEIKGITAELAEIESDVVVKEKTAELYLKRSESLKAALLKTAEYSDLERQEQSLERKREHWEQALLKLETEEIDLIAPPAKEKPEEQPK